jgi:hypothetical protein
MSRGGPYGYRFKQRSNGTGTYPTTTTFIEDNPRLNHRRGDIVKFGNQDYLPKILKKQFAVVLDRYKMTRHKGCHYTDYYAVIMLITGPNKGEVYKRNSMHGGFSKVNF